jgi:hypothetical protein
LQIVNQHSDCHILDNKGDRIIQFDPIFEDPVT